LEWVWGHPNVPTYNFFLALTNGTLLALKICFTYFKKGKTEKIYKDKTLA
jgi:hypothetical protein